MKTPMEKTHQNRHDDRPTVGISDVIGHGCPAPAVVDVGLPTVGELARQNFVTLPAWFGCAQACAVLRLKGMDFVLVSDDRGVRRVASLEQLTAAPAERGIAACAIPFGPGVALATPADRALRLMDAHGSDHAGVVVSGGVVVGIVSREALAAAVAEACARTRGTYQNSGSGVPGCLAAA
jgi:CBS domain-containing protein